MPSEHSASSIAAQVGARGNKERVTTSGRRVGRQPTVDSEDEERAGSEDGSESEDGGDDRAAKAARAKATTAAGGDGPAAEGEASGLRGGGVAGVDDFHDDDISEALQYDDYEDFDDEYMPSDKPSPPHDLASHASDEEIEDREEMENQEPLQEPQEKGKQTEVSAQEQPQHESHRMSQSWEPRPYSVGSQTIAAEEFLGFLPQKKPSERIPRPYANPRVGEATRIHRPEGPERTDSHNQHEAKKGNKPSPKQNDSSSSTASSSDEDSPTLGSQTKARSSTAGPHETRNHHRAKTGVFPEAKSENAETSRASQAKPTTKKPSNQEKRADPAPNRYSENEDNVVEQDTTYQGPYSTPYNRHLNYQAEATYRQQAERDKIFDHEANARGAASAFRTHRPYAGPYADNRTPKTPFPPRGGRGRYGGGSPYGGGPSGGARSFHREPGKVPEEQSSPLRNETHRSQTESRVSAEEEESESVSEDSSESEPTPRRRTQAKSKAKAKAPSKKPSHHDYSSDDSEPPPPKPSKGKAKSKAKTGKPRARAESPPPARKASPKAKAKANQGKRRSAANANSKPPDYNDVVKDTPPNHYARLGLSETAGAEEIKKASRKMRVKTHPDQVKRERPGLTEAEMAMVTAVAAKVGEAADVLGDEELGCADETVEAGI
ncbi:MAG: hypothetical protein Q9169_007278 [Polycauliona sp. 2 TL-2023]